MHSPTRTRPSFTAGVFALALLAAACSSGSDKRAAPITSASTTGATSTSTAAVPATSSHAIKPFYGDAAGEQLTSLLRDHILTAGDLITAAKANDTATVATTKDKWYANADQIADFLSAANPTNWPAAEMRTMMHDHLDNTLAEAVDHLQGNYPADIADYDKVHDQILHMADMLTTGIIAQHPDKVS